MAREFDTPKMPGNWSGEAKNFYLGLIDVLEELHLPIREEWLSTELQDRLNGTGKGLGGGTHYTYGEQDTGLKYVTDKSIYKLTQTLSVTNGIPVTSDPIEELGYIINIEGFAVTSSGLQIPVNSTVNGVTFEVYKPRRGTTFTLSIEGGSGQAYVTVYYTKGDEDAPVETMYLLDNGYVEGITWTANPLPRKPYTTFAEATASRINDDGYLLCYIYSNSSSYSHNSHFATGLVDVPSGASKLIVEAQGAGTMPQISFGTTASSPTDSQTYVGNSLTWTTLTNTKKLYSVDLAEAQKGQSLRVVLNARGNANAWREARFYKVYFE